MSRLFYLKSWVAENRVAITNALTIIACQAGVYITVCRALECVYKVYRRVYRCTPLFQNQTASLNQREKQRSDCGNKSKFSLYIVHCSLLIHSGVL